MIPKRIHYCWFGGNPLTEQAKRCIDTWRLFCPDYEIIEWNESNFDIDENIYCREAYESKKWAFVTDYVRLKVLYEYGGIYMDTDVEVCKNLDPLLNYDAVSGYESDDYIPTGTMAACQGNEWIGMLLRDYDNRHFIIDGNYDLTTNVIVITQLTKKKYGVVLDGKRKVFGNNICMLPFEYLCAKSCVTGKVSKTESTFTVHHFTGSWISDEERKWRDLYKCYMLRFSWVPFSFVRNLLSRLIIAVRFYGLKGSFSKICAKIFSSRK